MSDESSWRTTRWHDSAVGVGMFLFDFLLTLGLVGITVVGLPESSPGGANVEIGHVPLHIYVFSLLGALGFVFTTLVEDFDRVAWELVEYNVRLLAALPLGAGIYLLADVVLADASGNGALVAGTAFLAGLYVNLAYERLGALARRLLPARDGSTGGDDS